MEEIRLDAHFIAQVVYDLLDSGLNYPHRTIETRASVTIQHCVMAKPIPPCLEKGILFSVETNAEI